MPSRVQGFCATGKYHNIEVEDDATVYAEYDSGLTIVFITSTGESPGTNRLEIGGTLGKLVLENNVLKHYKLQQSERDVCFESQEMFAEIGYTVEEFAPTDDGSGHAGILQNFCNSVLKDEPLIAPGAEGINQLTLTNAAYLSSWTNEWVNLPIDEEKFERYLNKQVKQSEKREEKIESKAKVSGYSQRWQVQW